ncbi:GntR family transcriptional regulator [Ammoniphilus resinae]|uniref:DNA-binding GntR family transcriptional regulator n=1 Tax=Ammoniphilus resinae TaxID=861532 RepID=A0ABS4GQD6_9BACL|nr:GntR family transcriptional regulator [Ammoniphilus resinae]MBP1932080.1 DNA-binding GntR family transcriptional regulator [Ammoniphilus resinae]
MESGFDNLCLNDRVYLYLRDQIIQNKLKPGTRIHYDDFTQKLGVSRTPLRDALNLLQQQGLVEVKPRSGSFVATPKVKDIEDIYDVRKPLECQAIRLAAKHIPKVRIQALLLEAEEAEKALKNGDVEPFFEADRHLHDTIITYSNNSRLISIMETLSSQIKWFGVLNTTNFDRPFQANEQHKEILKALEKGDIGAAVESMGRHIEEIKECIIADFS